MTTAADYQQFLPLPSNETLRLAWPTPNRSLFTAPEKFFARTRVNPDYGKPGWTRDCGRRFHRGCDIAPVRLTATGTSTRVIFTDCATGKDFESEEPTFVPHDEVFCVFDGILAEAVTDENASDYGRHVVVEHRWPASGEKFYTLYAHLAGLSPDLCNNCYKNPVVATGQTLGRMGNSSRSPDARNWLAIAPHLHFEVRNAAGQPYDPVEFLRAFLPEPTP
jgi:murein DD-endopeptidase MepM/ murein hydrolase activator NlpD